MKAERQQRHQSTRDFNHGFESQRQGETLNAETRAALEPKFGHSFGDVRVFADSEADRVAQEYQARAFTVGQDVYFANGEYDPHTPSGMGLLAHELTHTIQQRGAKKGSGPLEVSQRDDVGEREAHAASSQVLAGQPLRSGITHAEPAIARLEKGTADGLSSMAEDVVGMIPGLSTMYGLQKLNSSGADKLSDADVALTALGMIPIAGQVVSAGQFGWDAGATALRAGGASSDNAPTSTEALQDLFNLFGDSQPSERK